MKEINTPKLLPCAHCGSTDIHLSHASECNGFEIYAGWIVECYDCGIRTQFYPEDTVNDTDMDDYTFAHIAMDDAIACAVDSWNKRVNRTGFGG